jgi:translation elongation factor EF-4
MAIEAPYSKYGKTNFKIGIGICIVVTIVFAYDGYLSQYEWSHRRSFYEEHTKKFLFGVEAGLQGDLDNGIISEKLRREFEAKDISLSQNVTVSVEEAGSAWLITDEATKYLIRKEENGLSIYKEGPDQTMVFNRISPFFFMAAAAILALWLKARKDKKLVADENELLISDKLSIRYDSIEKIDKTYFDSKGYFIITFKDKQGTEVNRKLSDRQYDNLAAILDHVVAKIS